MRFYLLVALLFVGLRNVCISAPSQSPPSPPAGSCTLYTVKSGDTCYDISQENGVSLEDFLSWNPGINCNNLQIGQEVCISAPCCCTIYTVKSGDTCYDISQVNGVSLEDFLSWNPGINCNNLQIGQEVCISEPPESPPSPPSGPPPSRSWPRSLHLRASGIPSTLSKLNGNVFSEYIGALFNGVRFTDVPISRDVDFHFILGFAIDYNWTGPPTNGVFDIYWPKSVLTPEAVQAIKSQYSNVKVMVSLGGDTINGLPVRFSASSVDSWVANAVSSLTSMISRSHLDGIDIDYEHFGSASTQTFLKSAGVISIASIAPFDPVETQYRALWNQYNDIIDLVNFQFYSYSSATSATQFTSFYNTAAAKYGGGAKVLASFSTGGIGPAPSTVLSACEQLKSEGRLPGIFIFSADGSYATSSFRYEEQTQALVAANTTDNSHAWI
ncbi:hypothetical protein KP509_14G065600 [Ceratopteris richardii]|uniref:Chitinase n=1 Tax=Ceratopteris richardii TaxID=49495 RepID=A0A8T2T8S3_CERRI|nr:hypothetical protein KP509_14G065600 [Ceratopteris richardii]